MDLRRSLPWDERRRAVEVIPRPVPSDTAVPRGHRTPVVIESEVARRTLERQRRQQGHLVIVLSGYCSAPSVAHVIRERDFVPTPSRAWVGAVAGCPVYGELPDLRLCPHDVIIIDVGPCRIGSDLVLIARPESSAERHAGSIGGHDPRRDT